MVDVSIIIRCFNEEKHIDRLLRGIAKQETSHNYEIIVVDSGSTDDTLEIVNRYPCKIIHISPEDFSFGYSLNQGIENASGKFCVNVSAHCYPCDTKWLDNLIIKLFEDDEVAVVYGRQVGSELTAFSEHQIFAKWFPDQDMADCQLPFCNNANASIRKSVWEIYKYNEELTGFEDLDWAKNARSKGHKIVYKADACVYHIHEEKSRQIYHRYYREALAYREIFKTEYFGLRNFLKFFFLNIISDYIEARKQGKLLVNLVSIPNFRFLQFFGTYRAHCYRKPISKGMQNQLYYPVGSSRKRIKKKKSKRSTAFRVYDISQPLTIETHVWPGSIPFKHEQIKIFNNDGCNESQISMNVHTGTHIDAPYHVTRTGKKIKDLSLEKLIGKAYVFEITGSDHIDIPKLKKLRIPKDCKKLLLKTNNSIKKVIGFNEEFIAITPSCAQWLVDQKVELIGIDGPSVQKFQEENNLTHKILLENEVIVLENLNLSDIDSGKYNLTALPINISHAEGAPVRAILTKDATHD